MVSTMMEKNLVLRWDEDFFVFLKEWFKGLMKGIEESNDGTWPKILEMTGRACAQVHSCTLFNESWKNAKNLDEFIVIINQYMGEEIYKKLDDTTLTVSYSKCKCPLVISGLIDSPLICECSPSWLMENFENILNRSVSVTTKHTILRGSKTCEFIVSF
jgi:predicted hydrocarbon binding protein